MTDISEVRRRLIGILSYTPAHGSARVTYADLWALLEDHGKRWNPLQAETPELQTELLGEIRDRQAEVVQSGGSDQVTGTIEITTGLSLRHTTTRGEARTVHILLVQTDLEAPPQVTLAYQESGYTATIELDRAQKWLKEATPIDTACVRPATGSRSPMPPDSANPTEGQ